MPIVARASAKAANSANKTAVKRRRAREAADTLVHGDHAIKGKVVINFMKFMVHGGRERSGISGGAHNKIQQAADVLAVRNVKRNARIRIQRFLFDAANNANHGGPNRRGCQISKTDALAESGLDWAKAAAP